MEDKKDEENFILIWNDDKQEFIPVENKDGDGIFLEYIPAESKWLYSYRNASLIQRRTSERKANGIAKTGYVHPDSGIRYGASFKLELEKPDTDDLSPDLKKSQRSWYEHK
ncbi:MAG: hypothetical protein ACTSU2_03415 [Promethearchaeota archaeon]